MIFKYSQKNENRKVYTFKDLEEGETFMLSDPRNNTAIFDDFSVYMVVDNKKIVDLSEAALRPINNPDIEVYPVICECSVSLYPDVL